MPKRVDTNQREIVAALRQVGASVIMLYEVGHGCPDLLVGFRGQTYVLEIKTAKGRLTTDEWAWWQEWRGSGTVVRTVDEALRAIGALPVAPEPTETRLERP